ncbi:MAG: hypothetical protein SFU85_13765 [Candidatus Methylacidiphilales bacterium]|nr:hypothetical protein [Candidatus Methylacidiphilales bacterium]
MPGLYLVHQDPQVSKAFQEALGSLPGFKMLGQGLTGNQALTAGPGLRPELVFVQLALPDMEGMELITALRKKLRDAYFVPILQGGEGGEVWQRILQAGLRDVLVPPLSPQTIQNTYKQAESNRSQQIVSGSETGDASGYVVAVASPRGGVGKTVFAVNLTLGLCRHGAPATLLDFSMSAGDFFTMLDQVPRHTMADAIGQGMGLDSGLLRNLLAEHALGFRFLACPNDEFDFYGFDYEQAKNMVKAVREVADFSVIDTGAYDLPMTAAAVDEADLIFLLGTRDLARLMAMQRQIKSFTARGIPAEKIKIIINNAEVGSEISEAEIEEVLAHQVTAYLPSVAAETTFSINSGKPLMQSHADHPFSAVVSKLAEYTAQRWDDKPSA